MNRNAPPTKQTGNKSKIPPSQGWAGRGSWLGPSSQGGSPGAPTALAHLWRPWWSPESWGASQHGRGCPTGWQRPREAHPGCLAAFQEGVGSLGHVSVSLVHKALAQLMGAGMPLHKGASPALGRHHDRNGPDPLQRGLADGVGAGLRKPRLPADGAIAPGHLLWGRRCAGRHHQRLRGSRGGVAAVGVDRASTRAP